MKRRALVLGMILAAERGRIGERYILGGPYVSFGELFAMAARAADRKPPRLKIPLPLLRRCASRTPLQQIGEVLEQSFGLPEKRDQCL